MESAEEAGYETLVSLRAGILVAAADGMMAADPRKGVLMVMQVGRAGGVGR
jgi:hypothetical protein